MCPQWTESETQPISLKNTLQIIDTCISNEDAYDRAIDIGGAEVLTYKSMLAKNGGSLGQKADYFLSSCFFPGAIQVLGWLIWG